LESIVFRLSTRFFFAALDSCTTPSSLA
jgi:hypothetical protein